MIIYSLDILLSQFWSSSLFHVWFIFNEFYCQFTKLYTCQTVQSLSRFWLFATPWTAARQASLSITNSRICSNSCPLSQWPSDYLILCCYLLLLPSVFPASGSFSMSHLVASYGQNIGVSASVLPVNIHSWFPLRLTCLISLLSKELSRVFTVQKHQVFSALPSLWPNSHIHTWLME